MEVGEVDFSDLLVEVKFLREQRDSLQARGTALLEEVRSLKRSMGQTPIRMMLAEFKLAMHQHIGSAPGNPLPPDNEIRLAAKIIAEEAIEVLVAMMPDQGIEEVGQTLHLLVEECSIDVDMPALADGLTDLDYVVEGCRATFGIDGGPVLAAVHAANMAKAGAGKREDGKQLKPPGWQPPDVAGELRKQGWPG